MIHSPAVRYVYVFKGMIQRSSSLSTKNTFHKWRKLLHGAYQNSVQNHKSILIPSQCDTLKEKATILPNNIIAREVPQSYKLGWGGS